MKMDRQLTCLIIMSLVALSGQGPYWTLAGGAIWLVILRATVWLNPKEGGKATRPAHHPNMSRFEFDLLPSGQYYDYAHSENKHVEELPACPDCYERTTHPAYGGPCKCPWPPIFGRHDAHIMKYHHTCRPGVKRAA